MLPAIELADLARSRHAKGRGRPGGRRGSLHSLAWLGAPQWAARLPQDFTIPTLVGELVLALWLLVFGVGEFSPRPEAAAIATSPPQNR